MSLTGPIRPPIRISSTALFLHWIVAVSLLGMIGFGLYISWAPRGPDKTALIQVHKSFGMMVLVLLVVRLWWRLRRGFPPPVAPLSRLEQKLSRLVHWALLVLPLVMVASGMVRSLAYARGINVFGIPLVPRVLEERNVALNEISGTIHDGTAFALMVLITLHVAGALRHHFIKKDDTLRRMLGLHCGGASRNNS